MNQRINLNIFNNEKKLIKIQKREKARKYYISSEDGVVIPEDDPLGGGTCDRWTK